MRLRIASIAFLLASASAGISWLTLQPLVMRLIEVTDRLAPAGGGERDLLARARGLLPFYLGLDLLVLACLIYAVLHVMVGRPLRHTQESIEQLERLGLETPLTSSGGPLLSRVQGALRRMAEALRTEQATTRRHLTELKAKNEELARTQMELLATERLATVGKLAAGVAHEVGNPMSGILGYLSLAKQRGAGDPELLDFLHRTEAELQRIGQIVRGLLDLGRPSRGAAEPVDVGRLVESCIRLVSGGPEFAGVQIAVEIEPGTVARSEPGPLSQVLINLFLNAAQAMGEGGTVRVRCTRIEERVVLDVEDSGPGIAPWVLPRLFEPFFTTKGGKGSGLGLAISMHLVNSMGGRLSAANLEAGGARFRVELPYAAERPA